ncbi:hypothetical protein ACFQY9_35130 [Microvirga aerilata]
MSSPTMRGALIGGVVGVLLHLLVRFILHNFLWLAATVGLILILGRCSPDNPKLEAKRAALSRFDATAVTLSNVQAEVMPGTRHVSGISALISNRERARIYDVFLRCEMRPRAPQQASDPEPVWDVARVASSYHYGYVNPGAVVMLRLRLDGDGYLSEADPQRFTCTPQYKIETVDLLTGQP